MKPIDILTLGEFSRRKSQGLCTTCIGPAILFRDELSHREHEISGMCQKCQDSVFGGEDAG